ncbi:MAG: energy-coupling factor ABC transporter permease [Armatimonadetes bacterium]|nr:energy-coupling factor ABC transporter permease [Armatimonadota bacterium]
MHIPDGYLSTGVWATLDAVSAGTVVVALKRTAPRLEEQETPLLGMMAALVFAAQMLNFPIGGGTSGHLIGSVLIATLLGVGPAILVMTTVFLVQAVLFGDGGYTALGANLFNMGIVGCLLGGLGAALDRRLSRQIHFPLGVPLAAWLAVVVAASLTALEMALSGTVSLTTVLPLMVGVHAIVGLGEAAITVAALTFLQKTRTLRVRAMQPVAVSRTEQRLVGKSPVRRPSVAAGILMLLAAALIPFGSSLPDGLERVVHHLGIRASMTVPIRALLPDYSLPGVTGSTPVSILVALVGMAAVAVILLALGAWLHRSDARWKVVGALTLNLVIVGLPVNRPAATGVLAVPVFLLLISVRVPLRLIATRLLPLLPFVLLSALSGAGRGGYEFPLLIAAKCLLCVLVAVLLTATTPLPELITALRGLRVPSLMVSLMFFMVRFLFVLQDEAQTMHWAYLSRSGRRRDLRQARFIGAMVGCLIGRTYRRSERTHAAMLSRNFNGRMPTVTLRAANCATAPQPPAVNNQHFPLAGEG